MTFYFIARDLWILIIRTATDTKMVGEYLMFFQNNTRSKFTIAKKLRALLFHRFNQPRVH